MTVARSPHRLVALAVALAAPLATLTPAVAHADEPVAVEGQLAYVRPTEADGFDGLAWGADLKALYARFPALKKNYPAGKVAGILKKGGGAILETRLKFKGVEYPGKLYIDAKGLYRVAIEVKVDESAAGPGGGSIDKLLDPILGDLSTPDEETAETRLWKGSATVVSVTRTRGVGSSRLDIGFHAKAAYRPENAGGSLGIE
jgi:hypothetical protein